MTRLLLALLLAGPVLADTKTVSWIPATRDTAGNLLPVGQVWTAAAQYPLACPPQGQPTDGRAVPALPGIVQEAVFDVPAGTCSCFSVVTWVWVYPPKQYLSAPINTEACVAGTQGGCHAAP